MDYNPNENGKKVSTVETWKKLWPIVKPYTKYVVLMMLLMLMGAAVDTVTPLMSGFAVDRFIEPRTTEGLIGFFFTYLGIIILQCICTIFMAKIAIKMELYISRDMRKKLFRHLQELSFDYYNTTPVGTIMSRVMSDTGKIGGVFSWGIVNIFWSSAYIIFSIIMMSIINWQMALQIIAIMPVIGIITFVFHKKFLDINRKVRSAVAEITRNFNEGITGAKTTKTLGTEEKNTANFEVSTLNMRNTAFRSIVLRTVYVPMIAMLTSMAVVLVLTNGGNMVLGGVISVGTLTVFFNYALAISDPVQQFSGTLSDFMSTQVNIERCNYLLELEPLVKDSEEVIKKYGTTFEPKKENWEPLKGHITFEDVTFMYPDGNENVLEHFTLDIPAGTTVAIVGETGAGKSTLVNLACRFFEPTGGRILIDGVDYKERSLLWLHSNIGYVLQTPHLFSGSVKDNIRYGRLDATDEEIMAAAKLVSAHDSIMRMENGYDSDVGEGGDQLSTGEKQLVSFARAVLADPRIFVLDEATSSIDTETEQIIQNAISNLLGSRTSFLIAHRLSTIRRADVILVVKAGKIIERGTHEELLKQKGHYFDLYNKQFAAENTGKAYEAD